MLYLPFLIRKFPCEISLFVVGPVAVDGSLHVLTTYRIPAMDARLKLRPLSLADHPLNQVIPRLLCAQVVVEREFFDNSGGEEELNVFHCLDPDPIASGRG
jgi:hypothetical protein